MKSKITFIIGLSVTLLSVVQFIFNPELIRLAGFLTGLFFMTWGWIIGWTAYRNFTVILGHIAVITGCLLTTWGIYQIPFLTKAPGIAEVFDLPIFWGLFTLWGGNCMITHGYCKCAIHMHQKNNPKDKGHEMH